MQAPSPEQARAALNDARRSFVRALSGWTADLLSLRRGGLTDAEWTPTSALSSARGREDGAGVLAAGDSDPAHLSDAA